MVAVIAWAVASVRRTSAELETAREALLKQVIDARAGINEEQRRVLHAAQRQLFRASGKYIENRISPELRSLGLESVLKRPSVYVRAELTAFDTLDETKRAISRTRKDALLLCLLEPAAQAEPTEKQLLEPVYVAHRGGEPLEQRTPTVLRLQDAVPTLELLSESWVHQVTRAREIGRLRVLQRTFKSAPIAAGLKAARAELLIYTLDEPIDKSRESSFDGGGNHAIRVGLIELNSGKELLRYRQQVDLSRVSEGKRLQYGGGVTDCQLAAEVRAFSEPAAPAPTSGQDSASGDTK